VSRPIQAPAREVPLSTRQAIARRVGEAFNSLNPDEKRRFCDETLTVLVNMKPKQLGKLFGKFIKKGRPSAEDLETVNQLIIVFLYSVREEFRYHYATMIFKRLRESSGIPIPEDLTIKLEAVRKLKFIHAGVSPEIYDKVYAEWERLGVQTFDELFNHLLSANK